MSSTVRRCADTGSGRRGLLAVLAGNMLIDALEVSTQVVALPTVRAELGLSLIVAQWMMTGFAVGFGGFLLVGTRLLAGVGRRRAYLAGLLIFAVASLVAGLTDDVAVLIAIRIVKGCCVALTAATGLAIITGGFPPGPARNRAVSVYTMFGASGFAAGLLLSGLLTPIDWHLTMAFPGPVVLILFAVGLRLIPDTEPPAGHRPGEVATVLRSGPFIRSALGAAALNGSYLGLLFVATFQLQSLPGWTPFRTALAFLGASVPLAGTALHSGRMVSRFGAPRLIAGGALSALAGYLLYPHRDVPASYVTDVLPTMLLVGVGFVLAFTALNMQAVTGVAASARGAVVGAFQAAVQAGAAVLIFLVAALSTAHGSAGETFRPALWLVTAVGGFGLLVAVSGVLPKRSRAESRESSGGRADVRSETDALRGHHRR